MSEKPYRRRPGLNTLVLLTTLAASGGLLLGCTTALDFPSAQATNITEGINQVQELGHSNAQNAVPSPLQPARPAPNLGTEQSSLLTETVGVSKAGAPVTDQPCIDQAEAGRPIDMNIPDDTVMQPGQEFSKTWRLINVGTCTWNSAYNVIWYWGEQMSSALALPLEGETVPGKQAYITVNFVAPQKPGVYQSNWKLRSPAGRVFGVGPGEGLYFYVRIRVAGSPVPEEDGRSLIVQNTPTPYAGGPTRLLPSDRIDLDKNTLNPTTGEDVAMSSGDPYFLAPFDETFFSVYGKTQPTESQCLSTEPSKIPLRVDDLESGIYLCYLTNEGRSGWMRIQNFWTFQDRALLNLEVYTWPLP
jgi:hypothetical protein